MSESLQIDMEYRCLLAKLEELLRVYRVAKKNDKNNALQERVRNKSNEIIVKLKVFPNFVDVQQQYRNKVESAFTEIRPEAPAISKPARENLETQKTKPAQFPKKNGFSSVSNYSGYSSQSSQISNTANNLKKQKAVVQQKIKTPSIIEKPKQQPLACSKTLKEEVIEVKKVIQTPKIESNPQIQSISDSMSSKSHKSLNQIKKETSISTIKENLFHQKEKSQGSQESFLGLLDENYLENDFINVKVQPEAKIQTPPSSLSFDTTPMPKIEKEEDVKSQVSATQNNFETIANFCRDNKQKLNTEILFNQDVFDYMRDQQGDFIYLIGVNKPQGKRMQKLYACTLMKFSIAEVMKCDELFEKQTRDFKNNIRTPIGLVIKGDNASAIQPEHLKFLINLQCPFMIILVLKDIQQYDGVLCYFNDSIIDRIRFTPRKQLGQCAQQLAKKTYVLPYNQSYLPKEKTRYVITKCLNRTIANVAEEAPNAITISDNQCIREEKNPFNYKVHQKFLTNLKTEHTIYYVNNGVANARLSYKTFEAFKSESITLQPKLPAIFSLTLGRDNMPVKKEFFEVCLQCSKIRDPNIFINLSNMSAKRCIVVALKPEVTMEMLDKVEPIQLKNFEKNTVLTYCLLVIGKNNIKQFEADAKNQLVELKSP